MTTGAAIAYEGLQLIGRSAFALTYRAWAPHLDATVVLKVFPGVDPADVEAFVADLRRVGLVEHPSLVAPAEGGRTTEGSPYLVRRRVPGRPLAPAHHREPEALDDLLATASEIAAVLDALHHLGLAHGAISPANVIIDHPADPEHGSAIGARVRITDPLLPTVTTARPDGFRRDPAYVAPEVVEHGVPSGAGDVYAFGATVSAALGRLAAPPDLHALLAACLDPRPDARPTARTLVSQLAGVPAVTTGRSGPSLRSIPLAVPTPAALRVAIHPGDLSAPDLSALYSSNSPRSRPTADAHDPGIIDLTDRRDAGPPPSAPARPEATRPTATVPARRRSRWVAPATAAVIAAAGLGTVLATDGEALRSGPEDRSRTGVEVRLSDTGPSAPTVPTDGLVVESVALVAGPRDQVQLKAAVQLDGGIREAPDSQVVLLVGRTGRFTPPDGHEIQPRRLIVTTDDLGVTATLGETPVTAIPANPVDVSEEYTAPDGRTRATFASRVGVPVFYVPGGSEVVGLAVLDDGGGLRAFASAAEWPERRSANSF